MIIGILVYFPSKEHLDPEDRFTIETLFEEYNISLKEDRPGTILARENLQPVFPIVMIPGIISTGLQDVFLMF